MPGIYSSAAHSLPMPPRHFGGGAGGGISARAGFREMADAASARALGAAGSMRPDQKTTVEPPGKTVGGAMMSAAGGAAMGTAVAGPGWGTAGGAVFGLVAYAMS